MKEPDHPQQQGSQYRTVDTNHTASLKLPPLPVNRPTGTATSAVCPACRATRIALATGKTLKTRSSFYAPELLEVLNAI